jgi:hypothetical protein
MENLMKTLSMIRADRAAEFAALPVEEQNRLIAEDEAKGNFRLGVLVGTYAVALSTLLAGSIINARKSQKRRIEEANVEYEEVRKKRNFCIRFINFKGEQVGEHYIGNETTYTTYEEAKARALEIQLNKELDLYYTTFTIEDLRDYK